MFETDDAALRVPFIWKGSAGMEWWFEARGIMWVLATITSFVLTPVAYLAQPDVLYGWLPIPALFPKAAVALVAAVACAVVFTRWFGRRVKPTTPIRHHVSAVQRELGTPRPDAPDTNHVTTITDYDVADHGAVLYVVSPERDIDA
ncbi:MAG: hypothetical protein ACRCSN_15820 [Dermatophilaceae bacterium]